MLRSVSFRSSLRSTIAIPISGGALEMAMKYENGARLNPPDALRVDTKAIGRGTTALVRNEYIWGSAMSAGRDAWR